MTDTHLTFEDEAVLRRVGRYDVLREVGHGGTAAVYLARQTDLERRVALKELAAFHATDAAFAERFLREARLAGSLNHPNIVTVHEYFEHEGTPYIAMEYFERGSLRPLVGRLSVVQVAGVLDDVLAGLKVAEAHGIVHRDLKPENVMVTVAGAVKITDFGIAKALLSTPGSGSLTSSGSTVGTPAYMAPELALGKQIGPWTDLYALGVMAYELLAGSVPFDRSEMPVAILLRHVNEPVAPLRSISPDLDARLSGWVERLLAKDPASRPSTAAEASAELDEVLVGILGPRWRREAALIEPGAADSNGQARVTVPISPRTAEWGTVRLSAVRRRFRNGRLMTLGAVLLAAGGAAAGLLLTRGQEHTPPGQHTSTGKPALIRDVTPAAAQRLSVSVSGSSVFIADPRGRVIALAGSSLASLATSTDPVGPESLAMYKGRLLVADGKTLVRLTPDTLAPLAAQPFTGVTAIATVAAGPPVAIAARGALGRVCTVTVQGPIAPCTALPFAPTGVGAVGSRIAVADGGSGTVALFTRRGTGIVRSGEAIAVGKDPHGVISGFRAKFYVPVERGIVVIDAVRRGVRRISLPVTPSALWLVPFEGRLFAALPATGQVAVLDVARPASITFVRVGGEPVAVAGGATAAGTREVVVVDGASGRVTRLDARTGARIGAVQVAALASHAPSPLVLRDATSTTSGSRQTITLALRGGLDPRGVSTPDLDIRDGRALIALWQGGVTSAFASRTLGAVTIGAAARPGRLELEVSAVAGAFVSLDVVRRDRHTVVLELTQAPPTVRPGSGRSSNTVPTKPTKPKSTTGGTTTTTPLVQD